MTRDELYEHEVRTVALRVGRRTAVHGRCADDFIEPIIDRVLAEFRTSPVSIAHAELRAAEQTALRLLLAEFDEAEAGGHTIDAVRALRALQRKAEQL